MLLEKVSRDYFEPLWFSKHNNQYFRGESTSACRKQFEISYCSVSLPTVWGYGKDGRYYLDVGEILLVVNFSREVNITLT